MADILVGSAVVAALAITGFAAVEAIRAQAWAWLISMILLWPVGIIAWFVAGRRFYRSGE